MKTIIFNPFERYTENKLLFFGVLFTLIGSYLGYVFEARFDGVLDLHFPGVPTHIKPVIDNLINIVSLFLVLFFLGKYINPKTRIIDILTSVLISRFPFYLLTFINYQNFSADLGERILASIDTKNLQNGVNIAPIDMVVMILIAGITMLFLVWFVILLFNGFKIATNSRGTKNNLLFAGAIILAEIISKIILTLIN